MNHSNNGKSTTKKLDELYELLEEMDIALMTTQRRDGLLVTRPMATQEHEKDADLWFVTNIEADKTDEIRSNPNVSIGYLNGDSKEWVSVSGTATISQDRAKIKQFYEEDWKVWFEDEGGERNGGPNDPRLALIFVEAKSVKYFKSDQSKPRMLFEVAKGYLTDETPDLGETNHLSEQELS